MALFPNCRPFLKKEEMISQYLRLLDDSCIQANSLEAIVSWLNDECPYVENILCQPESIKILSNSFQNATHANLETLLERLTQIVVNSSRVGKELAKQPLFLNKLSHRIQNYSKISIRVLLLKLCLIVFECAPGDLKLNKNLISVIFKLQQEDTRVIVRELSKKLILKF
ncbi:hypothetical protein HK096_007282 [Nowakowskiella sp. JEL0078]|nr:hypothetical protein HK096_007282 [Nowakowskiella sp. JEL0078]